MPVSTNVVEIETWYETCANCDCLLGDKKFTSEREFDEHPDREIGYTNCDTQDEWLCPDCRDDDAEYCNECGNKVPETDMSAGKCPDCVENEDNSDPEMYDVIERADKAFKEIGVRFYQDFSCCNSCSHAELETEGKENYVFYHEQDSESIRQGHRSIYLGFSFTQEMKPKVLEMIAENADMLQWAGNDHTKIFLTCDADEMEKQIEKDAERQERMRVKA